jgi:hypothetical protein
MSSIAVNNIGNIKGGGGSSATIGTDTGTLIDKCEVCYDPDKDNKCGEDAVLDIKKTITEKTGPLESSLTLEAVPYNTPSNIASDVYTWTAYLPHGLANVVSTGLTTGKLLDLVPVGTFKTGIKSLKITKIGTTLYRLAFDFLGFGEYNDFETYLFATQTTEFLSIARGNDIHLWSAAITSSNGDPNLLTYEVLYDTSVVPANNVSQKYWALYTVLRLRDLTMLNNSFKYNLSGLPFKFWQQGSPIERVQLQRVITFSNACPPKIITKNIALETVTLKPNTNQGTLVNQFDGLLLTFKIT